MGRSHEGGRWVVIEVLACPMRTLLICIYGFCVELLLLFLFRREYDGGQAQLGSVLTRVRRQTVQLRERGFEEFWYLFLFVRTKRRRRQARQMNGICRRRFTRGVGGPFIYASGGVANVGQKMRAFFTFFSHPTLTHTFWPDAS
jgi:hypothetical protein